MMKSLRYLAIAASAVAVFGAVPQAMAATTYTCSDLTNYTNSLYGPGSSYGSYVSTFDSCLYGNTANQASTVTTANAVLQTATKQAAGLISNRIANALSGAAGKVNIAENGFTAESGVAAGNMGNKLGIWASGSYSDIEDENAATAFDGRVYTAFGGVDYKVTARTLVGLSVGYEDSDIDTGFNRNLTTGQKGNVQGDGYTIAPYVGVQLSPMATATLTGGYSDLQYDTVRFDPISKNRITGSTDATRYFVNAALSGKHNFTNNWNLKGTLGAFYASEDKDAFTERESNGNTISQASYDNDFGQASVDARLGYAFRYVEPYALAGADFDFQKDESQVGTATTLAPAQKQASLDDSDFGARFGGGFNFQLGSNLTGNVEAYTVEFRDNYNEVTVNGGLRLNF